jgi:putative ABC transport system substrate-binding protein
MRPSAFVLIILITIFVSGCFNGTNTDKTIGIIVPLEHNAMNAIVEGFTQQVKQHYSGKVTFYIKNAQGDMNLQRSILQQFIAKKVDIIVPIGTAATQMSTQMTKNQSIVALAANPDAYAKYRELGRPIVGVLDELDSALFMAFLRTLAPNISRMTLIYSNSEKVVPEVAEIINIGKSQDIKIQKLMIKDLAELYNAARFIAQDSEAILILKDSLVVSGIQILAKISRERQIMLMTLDEGSIIGGGGFALAVNEKSIGEQGGILAAKILNGANTNTLSIPAMEDLAVFYNEDACLAQNVSIAALETTAIKLGFDFIKVTPK